MELKNAKFQSGVENTEFKIPNLRYIGLFSQLIVFKTENDRLLMFSEGTKENIEPNWVKQQQYWRERHNVMVLAWNASSSTVKQNDCKNKKTWLTKQLCLNLSLYFTPLSYLIITYIEDIKEFLKDYIFIQLFYIKRFSNGSFLNFQIKRN